MSGVDWFKYLKICMSLVLLGSLSSCMWGRPWDSPDFSIEFEDDRVVIFSTESDYFYPVPFKKISLVTEPVVLPATFFDRLALIQADFYLGVLDFSFVASFSQSWREALTASLAENGNATLYFKQPVEGRYSFAIYAPEKERQLRLMGEVSGHLQQAVMDHDQQGTARYVELGYLHPLKGKVFPYGLVALFDNQRTTFFWDNKPAVGMWQ